MSLQNEKTLEAYEKVAGNYLNSANLIADENKERVEKESKETKELIKKMFSSLKEGSKILEVGAANGRKSIFLESLGYQVTPSDIATDFLNEMRNNGLTPIKFNLLKDNFIEKYDGIFCWRVFVHFTKEDSLNALKRSYDALNDDGIFVFSFINRNCKAVDNEWIDFPDVYHLGEDRYFNYYTKEDMDEIISKTKFNIKEVHDVVTFSGVSWLIYVLKK